MNYRAAKKGRGELCAALPDCPRIAVQGALCDGHYIQKRKGIPFVPVVLRRLASEALARDGLGRKQCVHCREWRHENDFHIKAPAVDGLSPHCRHCAKVVKRRLQYGVDASRWDEIWARQGGRCPICGEILDADGPRGIAVDHDHSCCPGQRSCGACVRGIIHTPCNVLLAMARDSSAALRGAIKYLESWNQNCQPNCQPRNGPRPVSSKQFTNQQSA